MDILITGSEGITDRRELEAAMRSAIEFGMSEPISKVCALTGESVGKLAKGWAEENGIDFEEHHSITDDVQMIVILWDGKSDKEKDKFYLARVIGMDFYVHRVYVHRVVDEQI